MGTPSPPPSPLPLLLPPPPLPPQDQNSDHHDQLNLTPSNPSSPISTSPLQVITSSPPKKSPPLPWTHQETINLIQGYQEKWYSLKKGQLKASQWEEVAVTVAARCGYDDPSKSATQCRHKIEKLRKRYRSEKLKPQPNSWHLFDLMDRMERGPLPISARPMAMVKYQNPNSNDTDHEDSDSDVNYDNDGKKNKSKSINHIVRGVNNTNRSGVDRNFGIGSDRVLRGSRNPKMVRKRKEYFESDDDNEDDEDNGDEEEEDQDEEEEVAEGLGAEIRAFAERFVRMEKKKIEMMRDTERYRMEMENKRMEMILKSQQKLVDTIHRAFSSHKKMKTAQ